MALSAEMIERWADLLTGYCLQVMEGESILIGSELEASPLVEACARSVIRRGGHPLIRLEPPGLAAYFLEHASEAQLTHLPPVALFESQTIDGRIRIAAETDTRAFRRIDPARQAIQARTLDPIRKAAGKKRWVLTQYPTDAYAADAGLSLADYEAFVLRALFLDQPDPVAAWLTLGVRQAGLVDFMSRVQTIRIEAERTDLTLSVAGRTWINSDGRRNMPSGEIFTGPVEESVSGHLRCSFPVRRGGREVAGIALNVEAGRVVSASAEEGEPYLLSMLDLDPGARRFGELGLGLNDGIDRFTGSILFDEKIGGTIHLALGQSYPETGGANESALHWDLIVDLRTGGRITADGSVVMENGKWLVG